MGSYSDLCVFGQCLTSRSIREFLCALLLFCLPGEILVGATHFHGAHFWFRPSTNGSHSSTAVPVDISFRIYWRWSFEALTKCTNEAIASGQLMGPSTPGYLTCLSGCSNNSSHIIAVGDVNIRCLEYSSFENWMYGERTYTYVFNTTFGSAFVLEWYGNGWFVDDGVWQIHTKVDTAGRLTLGGRMNTSPRAILPLLPITLQDGCSLTVTIPVTDADGDIVRCRWAQPGLDECGDVCDQPSGVTLDSTGTFCMVTYSGGIRPSVYAFAIQLEDFASTDYNMTKALSSVPLQIAVTIVSNSTAGCQSPPTYVSPPTPSSDDCLTPIIGANGIVTGYRLSLVAQTKDVFTGIPLFLYNTSSSSAVVSLTDVLGNFNDVVNMYASNVTILTSSTADSATFDSVVCFAAIDDFLLESEWRCWKTVLNADHVPHAVKAIYDSNATTLTVYFDKPIRRPTKLHRLIVYNGSSVIVQLDTSLPNQVAFFNDHIDVTLNPQLTPAIYTVQLDGGSALSNQQCGIESAPVDGNSVLNFTVFATASTSTMAFPTLTTPSTITKTTTSLTTNVFSPTSTTTTSVTNCSTEFNVTSGFNCTSLYIVTEKQPTSNATVPTTPATTNATHSGNGSTGATSSVITSTAATTTTTLFTTTSVHPVTNMSSGNITTPATTNATSLVVDGNTAWSPANCSSGFNCTAMTSPTQVATQTLLSSPDYRWLIVGLVLTGVFVAAVMTTVVIATRMQRGGFRNSPGRRSMKSGSRHSDVDKLRRRQEKYFDTLCTDGYPVYGYHNRSYDPDVVGL